MIILYKDGGVLRCSELVWTGSYFMADEFYMIFPDDIEKIMEE